MITLTLGNDRTMKWNVNFLLAATAREKGHTKIRDVYA